MPIPKRRKDLCIFIQFIAYDGLAEELIEKGEEGRILVSFTFTFQRITERTKTAFQLFIITELPIGPSSVK